MLDYNLGDELPVLNHGYVKLLGVFGSDEDIVDAARISYDRRGKSADEALIRYLMRHHHTSPFEMAELKFELSMPIFVARQWVRHRTASMNEVSARYTELPDEMFVPEELALQSTDNKQGRGDKLNEFSEKAAIQNIYMCNVDSYATYTDLLGRGVSRELARGVLPLNIYTKFIWKIDLHNLMHFLRLRLHPHAQQEIREYAEVIEKLVALYFPITYRAFVDYVKEAYTCSRMEVELLYDLIKELDSARQDKYVDWVSRYPDERATELGMSKREIDEFKRRFIDG